MIQIGDVVSYRGSPVAYVVRGVDPYGRYLIVAKQVDRRARSSFSLIQAGAGDLVVAVPRPTFSRGAVIMHEGLACTVESDSGDWVQLNVPAYTHTQMRGEGGLAIAPSRVEISKGDAVLDSL